jgi:hypothetical protein
MRQAVPRPAAAVLLRDDPLRALMVAQSGYTEFSPEERRNTGAVAPPTWEQPGRRAML